MRSVNGVAVVPLSPGPEWVDVSREECGLSEKGKADEPQKPVVVSDMRDPGEKALEHHEPGPTTGPNGVRRLKDLHRPLPVSVDMSTPRGARDALMRFCTNFREKFVGLGDYGSLIAAFERKVAEMEAKPGKSQYDIDACDKARRQLGELKRKTEELANRRREILSYFPKEEPERNLSPTEDYKDRKARMAADLLAIAARYYDILDDRVAMAKGLEVPPGSVPGPPLRSDDVQGGILV